MQLRDAIRTRKTLKVLADPGAPWPVESEASVGELCEQAGWAPFHYPCHAAHLPAGTAPTVPWRFHVLGTSLCRKLLVRLQDEAIAAGKIANMLAAADALVLVTWCPDPPEQGLVLGFQEYVSSLRNMEHIAAASCATQNLLLLATDAGRPNYWSSGGVLRSEQAYGWMGIPQAQVLLGAIFLFPAELGEVPTKPGANRGKQSRTQHWLHEVTELAP